jgi:hypothetical protein
VVNTRSPIEAALDRYVQIVGAATEKFQSQMEEATRLLAAVDVTDDAGSPVDGEDRPGAASTGHRSARRRPGIFD